MCLRVFLPACSAKNQRQHGCIVHQVHQYITCDAVGECDGFFDQFGGDHLGVGLYLKATAVIVAVERREFTLVKTQRVPP